MVDRYFGSHEFRAPLEDVHVSSERNFGLMFSAFFTLTSLLSLGSSGGTWPLSFVMAALSALLAFAAPSVLAPVNRIWTRFGLLLHRLISPVILAILFYGCITPVGFLMRLTAGLDPLKQRFEPASNSYWTVRTPPGPDPASFKNQF